VIKWLNQAKLPQIHFPDSIKPFLRFSLYPQPHKHKYIKNSEINLLSLCLIELLIEKGLLTTEELDGRKRQVAERLVCGITTETMNITLS
jgi:hypothetical protein